MSITTEYRSPTYWSVVVGCLTPFAVALDLALLPVQFLLPGILLYLNPRDPP